MDEQTKATIASFQRQLETRAMATQITYETLDKVFEMMKANKPNDRSEMDRNWAIAITDMQKLVAFFKVYIAEA